MKRLAGFVLIATLLSGCSDDGHSIIGGVFFVCSYDPNRERHFVGASGNDALEDEVRQLAKDECDRLGAGVPLQMVYVYKDGSQKAAQ